MASKFAPKELCEFCDGCGWVEGGKMLKTTCGVCSGSGTMLRVDRLRKRLKRHIAVFSVALDNRGPNRTARICVYLNGSAIRPPRKAIPKTWFGVPVHLEGYMTVKELHA